LYIRLDRFRPVSCVFTGKTAVFPNMSAQLQVRLTSHPSAKLIFLYDQAAASLQVPHRRNRHSKAHQSLCVFPEIATEPSSTELQRVDIGTSAMPCYKRVPVYNVESESRLPTAEMGVRSGNPAVHSVTSLLRRRFGAKGGVRPVARCSPTLVVTVAGLKQTRSVSKTPLRAGPNKGEYEPLSKVKGKLRNEVIRRSSLSYWR